MTRPRTWDADQVLGRAMDLFHAHGFEHTSLRDIEQATGLHPGSVYQAYGSKAGLFEAVLAAYNERVVARRIARHLTGCGDPVAAVTAFFASTYENRPDRDPGCLLTNSAIESPGLSDRARGAVAGGLEAIRAAFLDVTGSTERADQLLALYQGLLVLVRFGRPRATLAAVTSAAGTLAAP
jgi:AcrR family transcriptional regulator